MIDVTAPIEQEGTKAVVRAWLKQVGDKIEVNDPLVELETDKVAVEVPAPASGILREIVLHSNEEAAPGAVLGRIALMAEITPEAPPLDGSKPLLGLSGGQACGSDGLGRGDAGEERSPTTTLTPTQSSPIKGEGLRRPNPELRLSPSVKRALLQHDIDPSRIQGTGRDGRITRADVDKAVELVTTVQTGPRTTAQPQIAPSDASIASHSVPHDRMRLRIAENMLNSVTQAPHVTAMFECDFSAIMAHRARHKDAFAKAGAKLTYTAYIVAAAAEAMKVAPAINSRWHDDRLEIYDDINIGVGTALGNKGLIVPVLRKVQSLSLQGIAEGLDTLVEKARAEKLSQNDVKGGTFTISNHGVSGSLFASPIIINQPQSAILGVGKLEKRVVVREVGGIDTIQIRPMAYVSLTIDHRVVDGHQTNGWLTRFVEVLETWPQD
ncbi:2-oxo acid dehydrogenase subunit E2 [Allosphingosinicella flava]|uniref:Dihydrolipoamide acetyltransferase component of pyruvate dehydrogenase complex n=1 Tax=Allosphingosinicella flava TaxID=2771430 RepID=A0A7T2GK22_9SPHN|nr:2-oxo acid dehydrogenase subunit E2 [Sphingosinicella flava]QPQ55296.1 2-oxo acid dehydrogenase subunit E2 [Sphingosinicella flava]